MAMLYPTYRDIINEVNRESGSDEPIISSRYSVVIAAAKRARQLVDGAPTTEDLIDDKPLSAAIDELYTGKIRVTHSEKDN
jgi:DNA-directed RNA polymerase subunit omega